MSRAKKIALGCLAVPLLLIVVGVGIGALIALTPAPPTEMVERSLGGEPAAPADAAEPRPADPKDPAERVTIALEAGSFRILAGPPGSAVRVEAEYDEAGYDLSLAQPSVRETRVSLKRKITLIESIARGRDGQNPENRVTVFLPPGVPLDLSLRARMGESRIDLTGLRVRSLKLDLAMGDHELRFSTPNTEPLEQLSVRGRMGEFKLYGLGHASPREFDLRGRMGSWVLDYAGELQAPCRSAIQLRMGDMRIDVPDGMKARVSRSVRFGEIESELPEATASDLETAPTGAGLALGLDVMLGEIVARGGERRPSEATPIP